MDVLLKITVSSATYRFYSGAAAHVEDSSPEDLMADVLTAYVRMLSRKDESAVEEASSP